MSVPLNCIMMLLLLGGSTQDTDDRIRESRRKKLEQILEIQDTRSPSNGALIRALSDDDVWVREKACLACASIQDSSLIDQLARALADTDPAVSGAASFALGQTASVLSPSTQSKIEQDVIWNRLRTTTALDRLLEEVGKFFTGGGMDDLLLRLDTGTGSPYDRGLSMGLARCAIRGVASTRGTQYLLRRTKAGDQTPWEVVYALQRIGADEQVVREFDVLLPLRLHPDPRARMHFATLLGKLAGKCTVNESLERLAEFDPDWRVRVNAIRALANATPCSSALFRRLFNTPDRHIQLAALTVFGSVKQEALAPGAELDAAINELSTIAENQSGGYHWQVEGQAAVTLAQRAGKIPDTFASLPPLRALQIRATGETTSMRACSRLLAETRAEDPRVAVAALEALSTILHAHTAELESRADVRDAAIFALGRKDVALTATAAGLLADSLFTGDAAVPTLLRALAEINVSNDLEAADAIIDALGALRDTRAISPLRDFLGSPEVAVALAARKALLAITGTLSPLPQRFQPLYTDFDFARLRNMPDTVRVLMETIRGNVHMELYPRMTPFTVLNFIRLALDRRYFDGIEFHRVVSNFVVQGGDRRGDGWGGPGYTIRSEFSLATYDEGSIGMASAGKDTEGSQFFITHSPTPHLDGRYTRFGKVVQGQDVVNSLHVGDRILGFRME
jgi:cyclophilin family peptidyl-prolyl cis-trans isomerase/HEAT repeat protein